MSGKRIIILLLLISGVAYSHGDPVTRKGRSVISGYIRDASSGEALIGATLYVKESRSGTAANQYGFYSLSLPNGSYTLVYSFMGYQHEERSMELANDVVIEVELEPGVELLKEVTVSAEKKNNNLSDVVMGVETLQPLVIKSIPALMGEVDIIKAVQMLPGVQSAAEGGTGFSVRGGSPDQNLILLDEATVYNASHLMGFFSVFNNDAISDLKLYKGDVPARYGGRLSSLLDVRMRDGNYKKFSGQGGIGLISSRLTAEGPITKDRTSFLLSGRRTYMDMFLLFSNDEDVKDSKLYFYDFNMKLNHRFNNNNRLFLSGYLGRDVMANHGYSLGFGNKTVTVRWNHIFNPRMFMNLTSVWSKYDYDMGSEDKPDSWIWESYLRDMGLKADFSYFIRPDVTLQFGLQSFHHEFSPGTVIGTDDASPITSYLLDKNYALEHAVYVSFQHPLNNRLSLRYGLRATLFQNIGEGTVYHYDENYKVTGSTHYDTGEIYKTHRGIEPRFGASYLISDRLSVKVNYNRSGQYVQQASNSTGGSFLDIWFPASPNVKPQVSDQYSAGLFRNFDDGIYQASVEGWYKKMRNTIDFADHAELLLNKYLEGEIRTGRSQAYGVEFLLKKTEGRLTGWAGYTWSRAERTIAAINEGKSYAAPYDKPHSVTMVASYEINHRLSLSANWLYATGQPMTLPVQRYEINGSIIPFYTERNGSRFDPYHRLDLSVTLKTRQSKRWKGEWVISMYNAYNRKNTWAINFKREHDNPNVTYAEKTYLFPVIPSISYNFKF